ncbi:nucleotide-diphospho-sugar transferase [Jaminaea rosea]|uniref:UDP-N-acetylglucosamine diphosphorylase n=1 Tax=Jaminaea rosea TaxID=1569628 RepID=A0A316UPB3_9BASI|nr:nucleotide-diphospho-sugar transferase [Jaminaea rosea]PWN26814.1 nucleotide-diphospho-sugar transferase [Jaminaea rosea]
MSSTPGFIDVGALRNKYEKAGQEHLFAFWDEISPEEQGNLAKQLSQLDVERVNAIYKRAVQGEKEAAELAKQSAKLGPPPASSTVQTSGDAVSSESSKYAAVGLDAIAKGEVGVLLLAGGQGTRLGSSAPKGCYDIGLPSHKSLFQLQAERILRLQQVAKEHAKTQSDVVVPWFIMTSGPTRKPTEDFFAENNYFGLERANIIFFEQGTLPCLTMDGKIMLDSKSRIATAPDGNGGLYNALRQPIDEKATVSVVSALESRGIKYLHCYGVDNCLVKVGDPAFLGISISKPVQAGVKTVIKTDPKESVGVVAMKNDKWNVIEYSEIPSELAEARDESGDLQFRAANIVNHFYTTDFLSKQVPSFEAEMAYHIARKKIPTIDSKSGEAVKPTTPNGMKLELFIFDVFPFCDDLAVHEVPRAQEFSPLKNAPNTGSDDPQTSRRDLLALHGKWLREAGAELGEGVEVEVSPLVSYAGEGLEGVKGRKFEKSEHLDKI